MGRSVFRGVLAFARAHPQLGWRFRLCLNPVAQAWTDFEEAENPAVIVHAQDSGLLARIDARAAARVNVSAFLKDRGPQITVDNIAVGGLAASHFLERRFVHFAFLGVRGAAYAGDRLHGFVSALRRAGNAAPVYTNEVALGETYLDQSLSAETEDWIRQLPRPIALFAASDGLARLAIELCEREGIACPRQIAILGVDNDDFEGAVSPLPISSVGMPFQAVGMAAAAALRRALDGEEPGPFTIPPIGVITRRSSDVLAIDDPIVGSAIQHYRARMEEPPDMEALARLCGVSRRLMERRFRATLGCSPLEELLRQRLQQVQLLLAESQLTVAEIGQRCGFPEVKSLYRAFRRQFGLSPNQYRAGFRN